MRIFDTYVQQLKYRVLKEVAKLAYENRLDEAYYKVPRIVIPEDFETTRCCIYKARAIVEERTRLAMGGDKENPNIIESISIACDQCREQRFVVSQLCRGCISHKCQEVCKVGALSFDKNHRAIIDPEKCVECGKCKQACPYGAIVEHICPCMASCKVNAISINENKKAVIDYDKCVMCGACVYNCPFGAMSDKSFILDVIKLLKDADENHKVYAVIAPAIVSQFKYAKIGQIVTGIKRIGFHEVVEAAFGADVVLYKEAMELKEKGKLTTSCCPAFVMQIEKHFPKVKEYVSHNVSPMIETARFIKSQDPNASVVFIGPCIAKKQEIRREEFKGIVDAVITFEELQSLLDSRDVNVEDLPESVLNNASYYGRIFAKSSGITQGAKDLLAKEAPDFEVKPLVMNGLEECKIGLLKFGKNLLDANFLEGMACVGGCINGSGCLHHGDKNAIDVDNYGMEAYEKDVMSSYEIYQLNKK